MSPLEDTIVALRPIIPQLPFELPNSIRPLHPMTPLGSTIGFNNVAADGNPTVTLTNALVNFGAEYVWHCHILSHEEMDMMRPVSVSLPPNAPDGLAWAANGSGGSTTLTLTWNDNSLTETATLVQRDDGTGAGWATLETIDSPLDEMNMHEQRTFTDTDFNWAFAPYKYRIVAQNTVGYGGEFMSVTTESFSETVVVDICYANIAPNPLDMNVDSLDLAALTADFGRMDCGTTGPACPGDIEPIGAPDGDVDAMDLMVLMQELGRTDCPLF